jgi:hypothetical protein
MHKEVKKMSKLLLDDKPLIVLPSLAGMIGLNESIVLQQLHYWLTDSKNIRDGFKWVYNTYEDWQKQFPFWSVSTIRRTITKLEKDKYIIVGNYNKLKIDNTKWYRIEYSSLDMNRPSVQNEQTECSEWTDGEVNLNRPLPEITTETTTKKDIYIQYAEYVKMKESERKKLVEEYGEDLTKKMIQVLDNYKGANGKKYKSDYRAILNWVVDRVKGEKHGRPKQGSRKPDTSEYDGLSL